MSTIQYSQNPPENNSNHQGDLLNKLPVDQSVPTNNELQIVNTLFTKHKSTMNILLLEIKDSLLVAILFIIFSLPQIDMLLKKIIPFASKSIYILLVIKALIIMILFWIINHFYLSRKSN